MWKNINLWKTAYKYKLPIILIAFRTGNQKEIQK